MKTSVTKESGLRHGSENREDSVKVYVFRPNGSPKALLPLDSQNASRQAYTTDWGIGVSSGEKKNRSHAKDQKVSSAKSGTFICFVVDADNLEDSVAHSR